MPRLSFKKEEKKKRLLDGMARVALRKQPEFSRTMPSTTTIGYHSFRSSAGRKTYDYPTQRLHSHLDNIYFLWYT